MLCYDGFNIANPLGNIVTKYKVSAFYFVLGNFSTKLQWRLKDTNLAILTLSSDISKYDYQATLEPVIETIDSFNQFW